MLTPHQPVPRRAALIALLLSGATHVALLGLLLQPSEDGGVRGQPTPIELVRVDGGVPESAPEVAPIAEEALTVAEPPPTEVHEPVEPEITEPTPPIRRPKTIELPTADREPDRRIVDEAVAALEPTPASTAERMLDLVEDVPNKPERGAGSEASVSGQAAPEALHAGSGLGELDSIEASALAVWQVRVQSYLMRLFRPPAGAPTAAARVRLWIGPHGDILDARLVGGSGLDVWDAAALQTIGEAGVVPAPPPSVLPLIEDGFDVRFAPR